MSSHTLHSFLGNYPILPLDSERLKTRAANAFSVIVKTNVSFSALNDTYPPPEVGACCGCSEYLCSQCSEYWFAIMDVAGYAAAAAMQFVPRWKLRGIFVDNLNFYLDTSHRYSSQSHNQTPEHRWREGKEQ